MRVCLLTGGTSSERDVALATGAQVAGALRGRGHQVAVVDLATGFVPPDAEAALFGQGVGREPPPLERLRDLERGMLTAGLGQVPAVREAEVIFVALHGGAGENGIVQALLDVIGVPYTGSSHLAAALAMDKDVAKRVLRDAGVVVPEWRLAPVPAADVARTIGFPCIVKPASEGSSVGLSLVKDPADLDAAVALARRYDAQVMIERFIPGRELTVGVLGDRALAVGEIIPKHELFDYECKYTPGMATEVFPADIPPSLAARVQEAGVRAHRALKLGGYSRVDFRAAPDGGIFCLEANTLPGMTANSLIPQSARAAGIAFPELCEAICAQAIRPRGTKV